MNEQNQKKKYLEKYQIMQQNQKDKQYYLDKIDDLYEGVCKINEYIGEQQKEESILLIGDSGEGKSTLLNYIGGAEQYGIEKDGFYYIHPEKPLPGIKVGHGIQSETILPCKFENFFDCPGFGGTQGPVQEILNIYSIYKLTERSQKIKLVLTISEPSIRAGKNDKFIQLVRSLGYRFQNIDSLINGVCLVITKKDRFNNNHIMSFIRHLIQQLNPNCNERKILEAFSETKIVFFQEPKQKTISNDDREKILQCVGDIPYIEHPQPNICVSFEAQYLIQALFNKVIQDIENFINEKWENKVLEHVKYLLDDEIGQDVQQQKIKVFLNELNILSQLNDKFEDYLGQISHINELFSKELKEEIDKKISYVTFIQKIKHESLQIDVNTKHLFTRLQKSLNQEIKNKLIKIINDIEQYIQNQFRQQVSDQIKNKVDSNLGKLSDLRSNLTDISNQLGKIENLNEKFDSNLKEIATLAGVFSVEFKNDIDLKISALQFIKSIKQNDIEIEVNTKNWYDCIVNLIKLIGSYTKAPQIIQVDKILKVSGQLVSLEDFKDKIQNCELVEVFCWNSLIIDSSITVPGANLVLCSPKWVIVGQQLISLRGKDGDNHKPGQAANGQNENDKGDDGLPGQPGFNGGNLYGIGEVFINLSSLKIDVSGGKGGIGQQGGNGAKGKDGGDGGRRMVEERNQQYLYRSEPIEFQEERVQKTLKFLLTVNERYRLIYRGCDKGEKGGDAGKGGIGGLGGLSGTVKIEGHNINEGPEQLQFNGNNGNNGWFGIPGKGGKNGPTYEGIYIEEYVLPSFRNIQEISDESQDGQLGKQFVLAGVGAGVGAGVKKVAGEVVERAIIGSTVSLAGGFLIQGVLSQISAIISPRWEREAYELNQGQYDFADDGNIGGDQYNDNEQQHNYDVKNIKEQEVKPNYEKFLDEQKLKQLQYLHYL